LACPIAKSCYHTDTGKYDYLSNNRMQLSTLWMWTNNASESRLCLRPHFGLMTDTVQSLKRYFLLNASLWILSKRSIIALIRRGIHNFRDSCCYLYSNCNSAVQCRIIVLTYLGSQCTKILHSWVYVLIFTSLYLESCIRPVAISRWIRQGNSIKCCARLGESATESLAVIRQAFGEESMSRTRVFEWHALFKSDRKKRNRRRANSLACS
jgi:hypothetical protein